MKYFKMIKNSEFIGAISSDNFICYIEGCGYMRTNEQYGEYVVYNGKYYRTSWMKAPHTEYNYTEVSILEITKEEYDTYIEAIATNQEIVIDDSEDDVIIPVEEDDGSIEFLRESKIQEMSNMCRRVIELGFDLELRGETRHFSLTTQDQLNLMNLSAMAQTQQLIPYHADGEACEFYTSSEINEIIATATTFKNYQLVYYNALRSYIESLETMEEITAITYGTPIPDEYKTDVLKVLEY